MTALRVNLHQRDLVGCVWLFSTWRSTIRFLLPFMGAERNARLAFIFPFGGFDVFAACRGVLPCCCIVPLQPTCCRAVAVPRSLLLSIVLHSQGVRRLAVPFAKMRLLFAWLFFVRRLRTLHFAILITLFGLFNDLPLVSSHCDILRTVPFSYCGRAWRTPQQQFLLPAASFRRWLTAYMYLFMHLLLLLFFVLDGGRNWLPVLLFIARFVDVRCALSGVNASHAGAGCQTFLCGPPCCCSVADCGTLPSCCRVCMPCSLFLFLFI